MKKTAPGDWLPARQFEEEGAEVIAWLSSTQGFPDITTRLFYEDGRWHWADTEDPIRPSILINGVQPWPEPPDRDEPPA